MNVRDKDDITHAHALTQAMHTKLFRCLSEGRFDDRDRAEVLKTLDALAERLR